MIFSASVCVAHSGGGCPKSDWRLIPSACWTLKTVYCRVMNRSLLLCPEQDLGAFLAFADVAATGFNLSMSAPAAVAKPLFDAPAHQIDTVAGGVSPAGREILRSEAFAWLPGLLPRRNTVPDLLD